MKCIAFNRRGTLLAAGCSDGSCIIWDFETRGVAKELRDKDCVAAITSICWSKHGHRILVSAADKSLTLWDVTKGEKIGKTTLQQTPLQARLHPGSSTPSISLACPLSSAPMIVDFQTQTTTILPVSLSETTNGATPFTRTAACFNKYGDLVYVGNSKGEILIIDYKSVQIRAIVPITGSVVIKNIVFSRNREYLLTNSNDRTIRVYENLLKHGLKEVDELNNQAPEQDEVEKLKCVGLRCLVLFREFQDSITKVHWKAPCFSGDGEWVIGGSASKGEHKIYIWDRVGHLVKILEGPKEVVIDLAWHPVNPIVVSVSLTSLVYVWAKDYTKNWSAFAPDFRELEENEEYVEREDEFDLVPETEKMSPLLFVLAMEYLTRSFLRAAVEEPFRFHPGCKSLKITNVCFADDLMLFCKANTKSICILWKAFQIFSETSGMFANQSKSSIYIRGVNQDVKEEIIRMTGFSE